MSRFKTYTYNQLLPSGASLILDMEQGILTLLTGTTITEQQLVSPSEMYIIAALLDNYPDYCPHEVMLSAMTGRKLDQCRQRVLWGLNEGTIDVVMRPVRNLLSRCRMKLAPFDITIRSMLNTGYILVSATRLLDSPARTLNPHEEEVYQ